jgi:hypothetical protein
MCVLKSSLRRVVYVCVWREDGWSWGEVMGMGGKICIMKYYLFDDMEGGGY